MSVTITVQVICSQIIVQLEEDDEVFYSEDPPIPEISEIDLYGKVTIRFDRLMLNAET